MSTHLFSRPLRIFSALALAGITTVAVAHAALVGIGESKVEFLAVGPAGLKIEGAGKSIKVSEAGGAVTIVAGVTDLKTGIDLRDDHLKKAINASAHPTATLVVKRDSLKFPEDKKSLSAEATGQFTFNGVTQPQVFKYKVERTGSDYHVQGLTTVDTLRYKMEEQCYLGACVKKDVKVKVQFKVREK